MSGQTRRYLGPAHGFAGCVLALGDVTDVSETLERFAVEEDGLVNWPPLAGMRLGEEPRRPDPQQWCHGAPGIVATLAHFLDEELALGGRRVDVACRAAAKGCKPLPRHSGERIRVPGAARPHGRRTVAHASARVRDARCSQVEHNRSEYGRGRYTLGTAIPAQPSTSPTASTVEGSYPSLRRSPVACSYDRTMVPEAPLEQTEHGLAAAGEGWFVLNARAARWRHSEELRASLRFEGETDFPQLGITLVVLWPGEPMAMYHWETDQEDFLVLSGEALLIIEGEERPLRRWDFVHCPAETKHVIVGAGDMPCAVLAVGAREHQTSRAPDGTLQWNADWAATRWTRLRSGTARASKWRRLTRSRPTLGSRSRSRRAIARAGFRAKRNRRVCYGGCDYFSGSRRSYLGRSTEWKEVRQVNASLKSVGAITLFVENPRRSQSFYEKVFDLPVIWEDEDSAVFGSRTRSSICSRIRRRATWSTQVVASREAGSRFQLTIWVDDADAVCAELAHAA